MDTLTISPQERERRKGLQQLKTGLILTPKLDLLPKYSDFRAAAAMVEPLPEAPESFGLNNLPTGADFGPLGGWGAMYNAGAGAVEDCAQAAILHSIMYWTWMATGTMAPFVNADALTLYENWTGYVLGEPSTDRGTVLTTAFTSWQTTGITDDNSVNHKILASLQLTTGDAAELTEAVYLLGPCIVGVNLCSSWQSEFVYGNVWDTVAYPTGVGAHCFPVIGCDAAGNFICSTWGGLMTMTVAGFSQFTTGGFAFITADYMNGSGKSPLGYSIAQLEQYLAAMNAAL